MNLGIFISQFLAFALALLSYFIISNFIQPKIIKKITLKSLKKEFQQNIYLFEKLIKASKKTSEIIANNLSAYPEYLSVGKFLTVIIYQSFSNGVIYDRLKNNKDLSSLQHILFRYNLANEPFFNNEVAEYFKLSSEEKENEKRKSQVLDLVNIHKNWFEEDLEIYKKLLGKL